MDDNEVLMYGYAVKGQRCYDEKHGHRNKRTTFISAYSPDKKVLSSSFCFEGHTDSNIFRTWLENCLLTDLNKGTTVIMDNASFHKGKWVKVKWSSKKRHFFKRHFSSFQNH